jgi:hypothetical protein
MKITLTFVIAIVTYCSFSQPVDTISITYDKKYYNEIFKDSLNSRYSISKKFYESLDQHYPLEDLVIYPIPILNLTQDGIETNTCKLCIENFVDFNFKKDNFRVIIYYNDEIVGHFLAKYYQTKEQETYHILNKIEFQNAAEPKIIDGFWGHVEEFELVKDHFMFYLQPFGVPCVVDQGKIFVLKKPKTTNVVEKIPINKYFNLDFRKLKKQNSLVENLKKLKKNKNDFLYLDIEFNE